MPKRNTKSLFLILLNGIFLKMRGKKTLIQKNTANQLLVKAREESGVTQKQVSETGIVSQSELSKIENRNREISFDLVFNLAILYEKDINYFIPQNQKK